MLVQSIKAYRKMAVHNSLNPLPYFLFPYLYYPGQGKKKVQMVSGERRAKGRALLEALERPGIS